MEVGYAKHGGKGCCRPEWWTCAVLAGGHVQLKWKDKYYIDVKVKEEDGTRWRLTGMYCESRWGEKENTWQALRTLCAQSDLPLGSALGVSMRSYLRIKRRVGRLGPKGAWMLFVVLWRSVVLMIWGLLVIGTHGFLGVFGTFPVLWFFSVCIKTSGSL